MVADKRSVYKQFEKTELLKIAKELGLDLRADERSVVMVEKLFQDISKEGVPEPSECSDLLFEFLVTAEYIDEEGNILEEAEGKESEAEGEAAVENPVCFSYADDRDPSCQKCKVFDACMRTRISSRPECFGKLYVEHDEQCKACLEALPCSLLVKAITKVKEGVK